MTTTNQPVVELAWAAGFFDGEGSTTLANAHSRRTSATGGRRDYPTPMLSITQHYSDEALRRFRAAVGGFGRINGPYRYANSPLADRFTWSVRRHETAQAVLVRLWPFLTTIKRSQAVAVFRAYNLDAAGRRPWRRQLTRGTTT